MTLYAGIDVSKFKHDLAILEEHGKTITKNLRFDNSAQGFKILKDHLEALDSPISEIHIALEDTGHYGDNLVMFLQNLGYSVFTYNPLLIKEFVKSQTLRKSKTDKKDALVIARRLLTDSYSERFKVEPQMRELKELTRYQNRLIHDRSKAKILYVRVLDIIFPELAKIVTSPHNQYVYELLTIYPSASKIRQAPFDALLKIKRLKANKANRIQQAAQTTIGNSSFALQLELTQLIATIRHFTDQIDEIQNQINSILYELDSPITSITGIGERLGATILAEIKNINNFKNPAQLQAYAGLEPSVFQSGTLNTTGHMVKRGSPYLRYALMLATTCVCRLSPHFQAYLALKRSQGKHYYVAISHAAKKLIRVIFHLLKTNQTFDERKLA